jgi:hypothetical protein
MRKVHHRTLVLAAMGCMMSWTATLAGRSGRMKICQVASEFPQRNNKTRGSYTGGLVDIYPCPTLSRTKIDGTLKSFEDSHTPINTHTHAHTLNKTQKGKQKNKKYTQTRGSERDRHNASRTFAIFVMFDECMRDSLICCRYNMMDGLKR